MKDYYYILGIRQQADLKEIQTAYHKLVLKFHPEQNGGDRFYTNYYRRIKEAYDVLSDEQSRYRYDRRLELFQSKGESKRSLPPPIIASFFASKKASHAHELITISWEVLNAETVYIKPIGEVASNGTQTVRLQEQLSSAEYIYLELTAHNADKTNTVSKVLEIKNLSFAPSARIAAIEKRQEEAEDNPSLGAPKTSPKKKTSSSSKTKTKKKQPKSKKTRTSIPAEQRRNQGQAYLLVIAMLFIMAVMLYIIYSLNPIL